MNCSHLPLLSILLGLPGTSIAATSLGVVATFDAAGSGTIQSSAPGISIGLADFKTAVSTAHSSNTGGVINFGTSSTADARQLNITYGGSKTFSINSSVVYPAGTTTNNSQEIDIRTGLATITPISGGSALLPTQASGIQSWTLNFSPITGGAAGEAITTVGFALLSRSGFSQSATVEWFLNGSSTAVSPITDTFDDSNGADNTFISYSAPTGSSITGFRITFNGATTSPLNDRRQGIDDLSFITSVIPEPTSSALVALGAAGFLILRRRDY